jgi:hypothetical protein
VTPALYQHPVAYLLGLEGLALLRAFSGVYDRDFTIDRFREVREVLDSADELGDGIEARPIATRDGCRASAWTPGPALRRAEAPHAPARRRRQLPLRRRAAAGARAWESAGHLGPAPVLHSRDERSLSGKPSRNRPAFPAVSVRYRGPRAIDDRLPHA